MLEEDLRYSPCLHPLVQRCSKHGRTLSQPLPELPIQLDLSVLDGNLEKQIYKQGGRHNNRLSAGELFKKERRSQWIILC